MLLQSSAQTRPILGHHDMQILSIAAALGSKILEEPHSAMLLTINSSAGCEASEHVHLANLPGLFAKLS